MFKFRQEVSMSNKFTGGFAGALTLLLVAAKLFVPSNMADVSWLWCFAPFWLPIAVVAAMMGAVGVLTTIGLAVSLIAKAIRGGK